MHKARTPFNVFNRLSLYSNIFIEFFIENALMILCLPRVFENVASKTKNESVNSKTIVKKKEKS